MQSAMQYRSRLVIATVAIGACAMPGHAEPVCLVNLGNTIFRINGDGNGGVEQYGNFPTTLVAMTQVPAGVTITGGGPGDIIGMDSASPNRLYKILNAQSGAPVLVQIGTCNSAGSSLAFANGQLFTIDNGGLLRRFDLTTFTQIGPSVDVTSSVTSIGGLTFDGNQTWYTVSSSPNSLHRFASPALANSMTLAGNTTLDIGSCGIEMFEGQVWMGTKVGGNLVIGPWNTQTGVFTSRWQIATGLSGNCGFVAFAGPTPACDDIDFNNNDVFPEDQDVIDFFNVLAGADCPACNDIDFNNNGVFPEDQDVIDFFNVLAGGACP